MIIRTKTRQSTALIVPEGLLKTKGQKSVARRKKSAIKPSSVVMYAGVFVALVAVIAASYRTPQGSTVAQVAATQSEQSANQQVSVNEVVATSIAANVAESVKLPIATNTVNLSASLAAKSDLVSANETEGVTKQSIMQTVSSRRELITYVAKDGDTVDAVAQEYGVSKDTIRWANDLTADTLSSGKKLVILPVDGVVHTVASGDTVAKLAKKYKTSEARIIAFNDLELTGLKKGDKIIVPAGILPEDERPGYVAPVATSNTNSYQYGYGTSYATGGSGNSQILYVNGKATSPGNRNSYGYCTWFAWEYRKEIGRPLPNMILGNANNWHRSLGAAGYTVNRTPAVGALLQTSAGGGGYGHVAVVIGLESDGSVRVREMNWAGWNVVSERTIPASSAGAYNYIH